MSLGTGFNCAFIEVDTRGFSDSRVFFCFPLTRAALLPSKRIAARAQLASTDGNAFSAGGSLHMAGVTACLLSSLCFVNPSNSADMKSPDSFFADFSTPVTSPSLTVGESPKTKPDWKTTTYLPKIGTDVVGEALSFLKDVTKKKITGIACDGMFGFTNAVKFIAPIEGVNDHHVARIDFGGSMHESRARLDMSGSCCGLIDDWQAVTDFILDQINPTLTRVDIAADFLNGEFTVEHAVNWYLDGLFNAGGRNPRHNLQGDWLNPVYGRTFEVGRRENGKMLRVYEKGRQKGDPSSPWNRFEVELRNKDRELPIQILTQCDNYFAGAYKCLEKIVFAASDRIATQQKEGELTLEKLTDHARASYGRLVNVMRHSMDAQEIIESISRPGVPARLERASLQGFLQNGLAAVPTER